MKIPNGYTEEEVLEIMADVANGLAAKFRFGYHGVDDMKQIAHMFALEAIDRYDSTIGSLGAFLWTHVRNRLSSYKRDKYMRQDKPCLKCPLFDPNLSQSTSGCMKYGNMLDCELYAPWHKRNHRKKNLTSPVGVDYVDDEREQNMRVQHNIDDFVDYRSLVDVIDGQISPAMRPHWIKMKAGLTVTKNHKYRLLAEIKEILEGEV